jgi:DNA polymerase-3 subunit epsilon
MNFVVIDFETANDERSSACALAVVVVRSNVITESKMFLINPGISPTAWREKYIAMHGITPAMVADQPAFPAIWPTIAPYLTGDVVAHNASFDASVLSTLLENAGITEPYIRYYDSVQIARNVWPDLDNHKLATVAAHLGLPLDHHNAISDATATAQFVIHASVKEKVNKLSGLTHAMRRERTRAAQSARYAAWKARHAAPPPIQLSGKFIPAPSNPRPTGRSTYLSQPTRWKKFAIPVLLLVGLFVWFLAATFQPTVVSPHVFPTQTARPPRPTETLTAYQQCTQQTTGVVYVISGKALNEISVVWKLPDGRNKQQIISGEICQHYPDFPSERIPSLRATVVRGSATSEIICAVHVAGDPRHAETASGLTATVQCGP